jgi:thiol-disulfide isomerase/thioredoxin
MEIGKKSGNKEGTRLLMFSGTECTHCHEMTPVVEKLEKDTGVKFDILEVWHNAENKAFLDKLDNGKCGGIPFFYNEKTEKWICGNTTYEKLKEWANG